RDETGVISFGFIGKLVDDKVQSAKMISYDAMYHISLCKSWEESGYTAKYAKANLMPQERRHLSLERLYNGET
ncbi:MAG: hypothetical protein IJU16_08055, partial [Clostridia bacterium]|nr:hypothetical protein [Clostridia bacterium]